MSDYMPKCATCEHFESCIIQKHLTEMALILWNISKAEDKADRKDESSSEKPNNCEWSVEYAKEMLNTMSCEDCGHWEHGAGDHYYCALLEMRQECYLESKDESTLMFANKPKDEPQTYKINPKEHTNDDKCFECDDFFTCDGQCDEVEDEPQTDRSMAVGKRSDATADKYNLYGKTTTDEPRTERSE